MIMETKENVIKKPENVLYVKRVKEGIIALIIAILDVIFLELIVPKKMGNAIVKMVILEKHAKKNAIKIVKIVIRMMVHVMNVNQNIILTQMIKRNVLNALRIVMGNVLWEYVKNVFLGILVILARKLVLKIV